MHVCPRTRSLSPLSLTLSLTTLIRSILVLSLLLCSRISRTSFAISFWLVPSLASLVPLAQRTPPFVCALRKVRSRSVSFCSHALHTHCCAPLTLELTFSLFLSLSLSLLRSCVRYASSPTSRQTPLSLVPIRAKESTLLQWFRMNLSNPSASPSASPHASPSGSPHLHAMSGSASAPPPLDLAAQLHEAQAQIERMNRDGTALMQRNAELEREAVAHRVAHASKPSMHLTKPKPPTAPEFTGAHLRGYEVDSWVREMKKQFDHYGRGVFPDGAAMVRHAALFFKGPALEWWDTKDKTGGIDGDWDKFVECVRERYRPMQASAVARQRIDALRQKGAVSGYCDLFQKEMTPITNMDPADQIFHFVKGLSSSAVQNKIREKDPKTLHAAMEIAVRAEVYHGKASFNSGGFRGHGPAHVSSYGSAPMDVNALDGDDGQTLEPETAELVASASISALQLRAALAEQQKFFLALLGQKGGNSGASSSVGSGQKDNKIPGLKKGDIDELRRQNRCFKCKQEGHMKSECPNPVKLNW